MAYVLGIVINFVGFIGQCGVTVPDAALKMYQLNFFLGIIVAGGSYYLLCKWSPIPACGEKWCSEVDPDVMQGEVVQYTYDAEKASQSGSYKMDHISPTSVQDITL